MNADKTKETPKSLSYQTKLETAAKLYWNARLLKEGYLRAMHPEWSEKLVREKVKRWMMYGVS